MFELLDEIKGAFTPPGSRADLADLPEDAALALMEKARERLIAGFGEDQWSFWDSYDHLKPLMGITVILAAALIAKGARFDWPNGLLMAVPKSAVPEAPKTDRYECDGWAVIDCKNMCVEEFVRTGVEADDARQRLNEAADLPGPRHDS